LLSDAFFVDRLFFPSHYFLEGKRGKRHMDKEKAVEAMIGGATVYVATKTFPCGLRHEPEPEELVEIIVGKIASVGEEECRIMPDVFIGLSSWPAVTAGITVPFRYVFGTAKEAGESFVSSDSQILDLNIRVKALEDILGDFSKKADELNALATKGEKLLKACEAMIPSVPRLFRSKGPDKTPDVLTAKELCGKNDFCWMLHGDKGMSIGIGAISEVSESEATLGDGTISSDCVGCQTIPVSELRIGVERLSAPKGIRRKDLEEATERLRFILANVSDSAESLSKKKKAVEDILSIAVGNGSGSVSAKSKKKKAS
jgi:hypothetical protein